MEKLEFLDLEGTEKVVENIMEILDSHSSDNNIHFSSGEKDNLSQAYEHSVSDHAPTDSEKNIIVGVQKNGEDLPVDEETRKIDIPVPTKLSELENDAGFITQLTGGGITYGLTKEENEIVLLGSDGTRTSVPDNDTIIEIDEELSAESTNPVQNKVLTKALDELSDKTTILNTNIGENIHIGDSVDNKVVEFALFGKAKQETTSGNQLFDANNMELGNNSVEILEDGYLLIVTGGTKSIYTNARYELDLSKLKEKTVYFKYDSFSHTVDNVGSRLQFIIEKEDGTIEYIAFDSSGNVKRAITIPENAIRVLVGIYTNNTDDKLTADNTVTVKGLIVTFDENANWEPYTGGQPSPNPDYPQEIEVSGESGSVEIKSVGKNLLKNTATTQTINGVTFTVNEDGSVTANGTATAQAGLYLMDEVSLPSGTYILSGGISSNKRIYFYDGANYSNDIGNGAIITLNGSETAQRIVLTIISGEACTNETFYPMLRACDENGNPIGDDTYEPYKETKATIPTTDFVGIKVSSGGNYTDSTGQQWICDEIVKYADGSGEKVQRIDKFVLDGSESWYLSSNKANVFYTLSKIDDGLKTSNIFIICNTYLPSIDLVTNLQDKKIRYGLSGGNEPILYVHDSSFGTVEEFKAFLNANNVSGYYPLAEPIRTPLTAEQLAEIEKLQTFKPVTNISNDADCGMEVTYFKDSINADYEVVIYDKLSNMKSTKLYSTTGTNTDGAMTQAAVTELVGDIGSILDEINRTEV